MNDSLENPLDSVDPDQNFFDSIFNCIDQPVQSSYYSIENYNNSSFENLSFTILNFNIRSFNANSDQFIVMIESLPTPPDVIILTETWLNETNYCNCSIEGYEASHTIRTTGRGGGVSIFSRKDLIVLNLSNFCIRTESIETCVARIAFGTETLFIIAAYRPPSGSMDDFCVVIEDMLQNPLFVGGKIVVAGDFNMDLLMVDSPHVVNFLSIMQSLNFLPTITKPTRFPIDDQPGNPSLLDHIWFNSICKYCTGILSIDITDHCPTFIKICIAVPPKEKVKLEFRQHSAVNVENFIGRLMNRTFDFSDPFNVCHDTDSFIHSINTLYCSCFPLKIKYISAERLQKPWLSSEIMRSVRIKSQNFKLYKLGMISRAHHRAFNNCLSSKIKIAKSNYYKKSFDNSRCNIKKTWSIIKGLLSRNVNRKSIKKLIVDEVEVSDELEIADAFNAFFGGIANDLDSQLPRLDGSPIDYVKTDMVNSLFLRPVTSEECCGIIVSLKRTSSEINSLPVKILVLIRHVIAEPLTALINNSLRTGIFPDILKNAKITPVFKSGDSSNTSNYRPISVLPLFSKIFERCLTARLVDFIHDFSIISPHQFGFLKNISTVDALIGLTEYIYSAINDKKHCISIFVDLRKAFDTVNHGILLQKLYCYGIRGLPLSWIASYLRNRQHCVRMGAELSSYKVTNVGVPQGSVLGPILFLFYINDLPDISPKFSSVLFADDTTLSAQHVDCETLIGEASVELEKFKRWTMLNRLSINVDKTFAILFTSRRHATPSNLKLCLDNREIEFKQSGRFLGVVIDQNLKFNEHISNICNKVSKSVGIMYKIRSCVPDHVLLNLYYSLVYPYLIYCNVVWGATYKSHLEHLSMLQKKIIRVITGQNYLAHTDPLFHETAVLKLSDIHTYLLALHAFKINSVGGYSHASHAYSTRNRGNIVPSFQRLTLTQQSVSYAAPSIWNDLPADLKECASIGTFKKKLKHFIVGSYNRD